MGTSTRKRNSKVKEILNSYGIGSDISKLPQAIPQIFATAISKKVIENEFSESVFFGCIRGGMSGIGAIKEGDFTLLGLGNEFIIDKDDPKTINEIKQSILSNWIYVNILDTIFFVFYEYFFSNSIGLKYPNLL